MSSPILITLPKLVNSTSSGPVFKDYVECKNSSELTIKGRKRRLDHLTWEEKLQRKKLKNRVAAQTSRDRKKQRMEEMEITIKELMDQNQSLIEECQKLRNLNKKLLTENTTLRTQPCGQCNSAQNKSVDCNLSNGSAESEFPLPQGQRIQSAVALSRRQTTLVVLRMLLACLLSQTSWQTSTQNSTLTSLKSLLRAYSKISPQTWKILLHKDSSEDKNSVFFQTSTDNIKQDHPREVVGPTPKQLESSRSECLAVSVDQQPSNITAQNLESQELIYASLDDTENCVTIIVSDEEIPVSEVEVVAENKNLADFVSSYTVTDDDDSNSLTPEDTRERALSDCGYESLGSPHSESSDVDMSELWNQSFSELFPNLM